MSILFGILLYVLCIAFFCTLTGINRLADAEPERRRESERGLTNAMSPAGSAPAREAHG